MWLENVFFGQNLYHNHAWFHAPTLSFYHDKINFLIQFYNIILFVTKKSTIKNVTWSTQRLHASSLIADTSFKTYTKYFTCCFKCKFRHRVATCWLTLSKKQPTFRGAAIGFAAQVSPCNKRRNSILKTCHCADLLVLLPLVVLQGKFASTNQKHYPDHGSDTSSLWNFCDRFSDVISRGNHWWGLETLAFFSG